MTWQVEWKEITNIKEIGKNHGSSWALNDKSRSRLTVNSDFSEPGDRQLFITTGYYRKTKVAIKQLPHITSNVQLGRIQLLELKQV